MTDPSSGAIAGGPPDQITEEHAIAIASDSVEGKAEIPAGVSPLIERRADTFVVTFPTDLEPSVRGADFHAQVTIDAATGAVTQILGGH